MLESHEHLQDRKIPRKLRVHSSRDAMISVNWNLEECIKERLDALKTTDEKLQAVEVVVRKHRQCGILGKPNLS